MSVNDASEIMNDNSRVMFQIVASLTDDFSPVIHDCKMFIAQDTEPILMNIFPQ